MKKVEDLNLGFSDAQNYSQRGNKQMLADVFIKNSYLEELCNPSVYYLIGEKGTGKTAYAVYLSNNESEDSKSILKFISNTDYEKFHQLKKQNHLDISGYVDIWKAILLLLLSQSITENNKIISSPSNLSNVMKAINQYYNDAFSPEIINALKIVDNSELAARLLFKNVELGTKKDSVIEFDEKRLQMNLFYITKKFMDCLGKVRLKKNLTLYIDGIDVRPSQIPYEEYLDCIKGLSSACWSLNTEVFANVRDTKGHFKVVLLLRPDIFQALNLQNSTNKLSDNSVYLDWQTTYDDYRTSNLYKMAKKLISYGQETSQEDIDLWDYYFDWEIDSSNLEQRKKYTAFMEFLRISLSRPRDIQRILSIIQRIMKERGLGGKDKFSYEIYKSDRFQNDYSEYFLSSLKDQLAFYYSEEDYKFFKKFFSFFDSPQFTFETYEIAYRKYEDYVLNNATDIPKSIVDSKDFLQLLYDCNVIMAKEKIDSNVYFHFSYREKSPSNISPEVPFGDNIEYRFHSGLYKKAHLGRY